MVVQYFLYGVLGIILSVIFIFVAIKANRFIGGKTISIAEAFGEIFLLVKEALKWITRGKISFKNTVTQMIEIGARSLPVTGLTSLFTGMVLALQTAYSTKDIFAEPFYVGSIVGFSMVKELGPVLTSLVVAGRVGAAITAELGTMKVTEQIDALYTLGTNPVKYLAVPRFIACVIVLPILTIFSDAIGILGGYGISVYKLGVPPTVYMNDILDFMRVNDVVHGLIKSVFFAGIIVTVACYKGFNCFGGAEGVGRATTQTVVISMVLILVSDYFLTAILVAFGIG